MGLLTILYIFTASFFTWVILAGYFAIAMNFPRWIFILAHYTTSFIATLLIFSLLYKLLPTLTPFLTMIYAMVSFFIIEILFFGFIYKKELWFLNFVDWLVPVFIISTTIYFLGRYFLN